MGVGKGLAYEYAEIRLTASGDSQTNAAVLGLGKLVLWGKSSSGMRLGGELAKGSTSGGKGRRTSDLIGLLNPSSTNRRFAVVGETLGDGTVFKEVSGDKGTGNCEE